MRGGEQTSVRPTHGHVTVYSRPRPAYLGTRWAVFGYNGISRHRTRKSVGRLKINSKRMSAHELVVPRKRTKTAQNTRNKCMVVCAFFVRLTGNSETGSRTTDSSGPCGDARDNVANRFGHIKEQTTRQIYCSFSNGKVFGGHGNLTVSTRPRVEIRTFCAAFLQTPNHLPTESVPLQTSKTH